MSNREGERTHEVPGWIWPLGQRPVGFGDDLRVALELRRGIDADEIGSGV